MGISDVHKNDYQKGEEDEIITEIIFPLFWGMRYSTQEIKTKGIEEIQQDDGCKSANCRQDVKFVSKCTHYDQRRKENISIHGQLEQIRFQEFRKTLGKVRTHAKQKTQVISKDQIEEPE